MSPDTRLKLGIALLLLGLVMPAGTVPRCRNGLAGGGEDGGERHSLARSGDPDRSGRCPDGQGELSTASSPRAKGVFKTLKPAGNVGRTRYTIGLVMFVVPPLLAWVDSYAPSSWLPQDYAVRVWVNLALDLTIVASLFVLGGDFWDKLRALFLHEARVVFPSARNMQQSPQ